VPNGHQAGAAEQRCAEIVLAAHLHVAGVQSHTDTDFADVAPILRLDSLLARERRPYAVAGLAEGGVHPVAQGFEHDAAVGLDRRAEQVMVPAHRIAHRVRVLFE
jgi:hypothetical protein